MNRTYTLTDVQSQLLSEVLAQNVLNNRVARDFFAEEAKRLEQVCSDPVERKSMLEIMNVYNELIHDDLEIWREMDRQWMARQPKF